MLILYKLRLTKCEFFESWDSWKVNSCENLDFQNRINCGFLSQCGLLEALQNRRRLLSCAVTQGIRKNSVVVRQFLAVTDGEGHASSPGTERIIGSKIDEGRVAMQMRGLRSRLRFIITTVFSWSFYKKRFDWPIPQCLKTPQKFSILRAKRATFFFQKPLVNRFCPL